VSCRSIHRVIELASALLSFSAVPRREVLRDNLDEKGGGDQSFEAAAGSGVMIVADLKLCKVFFGAAVTDRR
jgi:hypothetical protein